MHHECAECKMCNNVTEQIILQVKAQINVL